MKKSVTLLVTIFLFLCFWGSFGFCETNPSEGVTLQADYGGLPLAFIKNQGQVDEEVLYYLKGREGTIYFTKSGIVYDLVKKDVGAQNIAPDNVEAPVSGPQNQTYSRLSFTLKPQGANADVQVIPQDELPGKINYFTGNDPAEWHTDIPTYKSVIYQGLYPGIDLKVYGTNRQMEYDFIVHPGADPSKISLAGEGIDGLEVDAEGNLIIKTALTDIKHLRPVIYQEINGKKVTVEGSFAITNNRIGFDIKNYNKNYPLTIDPLTLTYSTYLGGTGNDYAYGIAVDSSGCAYVTGYVVSTNFPTVSPYQGTLAGSTDAFVTKFTAAGNALFYSTYLGGSSQEFGRAIAIDSQLCAYITGFTISSNFPTANAYDATYNSSTDAFISKLTFCLLPVADFSGTPTSGYAPLTVAFTDQSTNNPTSWAWNFGDEGTSDQQNPSHQYTTPGTYTVSLTATNACGNDTETKTGYITVNACPQTVANFSATQSAPLTISFTDQSTNNPTSWNWNFGDGETSTFQNPTHQYAGANTYSVTLTATNVCSSDSKTSPVTVVPLSIDITSPQNGESFLASPIIVTGTISCPATQVTVNGITATVNGTKFTAENVPLISGPNTITAVANHQGGSAQDSVSVTLLVPQGPVQYFYDDLGRLIRAQDEQGNVIEYTYDSVGNRQTKTITVP